MMGHGEGINVITGLEMQFATTGKNMAIKKKKKRGKKTISVWSSDVLELRRRLEEDEKTRLQATFSLRLSERSQN